MTSTGQLSGLIIEVPAAEAVVATHRQHLDASARLGIPAHITVLFPFMQPSTIDQAAMTRLEHLFATVRQFRFQLDHTAWFGDQVLWLAPADSGPFRTLTRSVVGAFPAFLPYQGQHGDSIPHLTIGHGHPVTDLRAAEESVQGHLPIDAQATAVTLMTQQSAEGQWARAATFSLATTSRVGL
jgi:2'-5' RNA ligase